jgi:hypothetical protein
MRDGRFITQRADVGFEHHVERARGREAAGLTRGGRWNESNFFGLGFGKILRLHRLEFALNGFLALERFGFFLEFSGDALAFQNRHIADVFSIDNHRRKENLIGAKALLGNFAIHHRVSEAADVAGSFPNFGMHDDGGFEADDVIAAADHVIPPAIADVFAKLDAERAVIPKAVDAAVDFGRLKDKSTSFAQGNDLFHQVGGIRFSHKGA